MSTLYLVVEYSKGIRYCPIRAFNDKIEAENFINRILSEEGLVDYKTTFSIEEIEDYENS